MDYANPDALVETNWLATHLDSQALRVIDATYFLPSQNRNAAAEYHKRHIPGAIFFDIDDISDKNVGLPHMAPDSATFKAKVEALGLGSDNKIIVYDANGGYCAAARAWWMFRTFGHFDVALLNGGLPKWLDEDRAVESAVSNPEPGRFTPCFNPNLVKSRDQVIANLEEGLELVVDARAPLRFAGSEAEPRPTEKTGHIPGSVNLPFARLMDMENNAVMRPADVLASAFEEAGIDMKKPVIASCGSGVTAGVIAFSLHLLGQSNFSVYDGSWAEWGNHPETPVSQ
jgi:thiosulfate/3-mercaptopyruvate sulfurtransferase